MLYPVAYCTENEEVCNLTIGEGEINAAASMMALVLSSSFDFRRTYWMFAGIAGVSPKHGTVGSVALAKYAIQVGLQYEIDSRDLPESWPSGYIPYGQQYPFLYPRVTYGTEVFELNENLRDLAARIGSKAPIVDSDTPRQYRAQYGPDYPNAIKLPGVLSCDVATSDVYFSGKRLSEAFDNTASIWTNGSGIYCMSAQEENATLEIMVRGAIEGLVDFARVLVMRGGEFIHSYLLHPTFAGPGTRYLNLKPCLKRLLRVLITICSSLTAVQIRFQFRSSTTWNVRLGTSRT